MVLPLGFTACDSDDNTDIQPIKEAAELTLSENSLAIEIGKTIDFDITDGGGNYSVFSSNEDVAIAELNGNTITVSSISFGQVSIIVSDSSSQYKEVSVFSHYTEILLEGFETNLRYGHTERIVEVSILQGNKGYNIESSDEDIIAATISDDDSKIILKLKGEGDASLTLTDSFGLIKEIPISIGITNEPYSSFELEKIMANTTNRVVNLEEDAVTQWWFGNTKFIGTIEDDKNLYGLEYSNPAYRTALNMWIRFKGDTSLGEKTEGSFTRTLPWYEAEYDNQVADVEIIKNDGSKIWGVWSFILNDQLIYGHFCLDINP